MRKNEIIELTIHDMTTEGLGVGRWESLAVFVKDAVPGDRVRARIVKDRKTYAYARLEEILEPGACRTQAPCPAARACGGCQLQAMTYEAQLRLKEEKVRGNLQHIGGFDPAALPIEPIVGMENPYRYRNKAQFPVGRGADGRAQAGFYAGRTHSLIPCEDCLIGIPENRPILRAVIDWMDQYHIAPYDETTGQGRIRHIFIRCGFATGQIMVGLIAATARLPHQEELIKALQEALPAAPETAEKPEAPAPARHIASIVLNVNRKQTNVILGDQTIVLAGSDAIEDRIGPVRYRISLPSFYQVNPVQTRRMYDTVLEYAALTGKETVWDLYCGIGTISLYLAAQAREVIGVEIVPEAVENARENAALNGITNARFYTGRAEDLFVRMQKARAPRADVVIVDPPRKGCAASLLETMLAMQPERIVYVSCDSATLARDLRILTEGGYRIRKIRPFDQFPQTVHVETVCLLSNRFSKADTFVDLSLNMKDYYRIKDEQKKSQDKKV